MKAILSERVVVPLLVLVAALLALGAALGDSVTIDEPPHLAAGLAVWHQGDFRLSPDHPPLARLLTSLPVYLRPHAWPGPQGEAWREGDPYAYSRQLFARNAPEALVLPGRVAMILILCATLVAVWWTGRVLWGRKGGALALFAAALDPGLLAHGHYVTTDVPITLAALVCVLAFARVLEQVTPLRIAAAGAALGLALLAKQTGLLLVPVFACMAVAAVLRRRALAVRLPGTPGQEVGGRWRRLFTVAGVGALAGLLAWAVLWAGYGFRYHALTGADASYATMYPRAFFGPPSPANMDEAWTLLLRTPRTSHPRADQPRTDPAATVVRMARRFRLLPEAYLFGLASAGPHASARTYYLKGEIATGRRLAYFPLTFLWTTPLATLALVALGAAAIAAGRARPADPLLAAGLGAFALVYAAVAFPSGVYAGVRHLLPLHAVVLVAAGAAWTWASGLVGRVLVGALGAWLAAATIAAYPGFLGYFNEIAGGTAGGYRLLADSNVDWSQDLLRLRAYERAHPQEPVALLESNYPPWPAGLRARPLLPRELNEVPAPLVPGLYVISLNELVGLAKPFQRASTWRDPALVAHYRALWAGGRAKSAAAERDFDALRRVRLVSRLASRRMDDRVGTSLFVYRLGAADIEELTRP